MFKLLCGFALIGLALAAPPELGEKTAKKRVERNKRGLLPGDVADSKLDLEHYAPLGLLEKSLELKDGEGDNEVNGTKKLDDKDIEYYHKKNQGTVKTIVEEKADDGKKLENVFYHLSYEKQDGASTPLPVMDTDQTLADQTPDEEAGDTTVAAEEGETTPATEEEERRNTVGVNDEEDVPPPTENVQIIDKISDLFKADRESLVDPTIPSEEKPDSSSSEQPQEPPQSGWFNNWFGVKEEPVVEDVSTTPVPALGDTPDLDRAIVSQQFTFLSPFCFGSIGLRSPSCPPHRPTLVSIYFFSFCV